MIDAVVRARMASARLPGKTLLEAGGKTMLEHTLERLGRAALIERIVVATTNLPEDDVIAAACERIDVGCFRGSADDVLGRVRAAAEGMAHVGHFGADNPLIDPALCDDVIRVYLEGGWDYVTNNMPPTFPDGQEVEVTSFAALEIAAREATDPRHREHLLTFLWEHPDRFAIRNVTREPSQHDERWTLDTPEDWVLIRAVFAELYPERPAFGIDDVIAFLDERPHLRTASRTYDWRR